MIIAKLDILELCWHCQGVWFNIKVVGLFEMIHLLLMFLAFNSLNPSQVCLDQNK